MPRRRRVDFKGAFHHVMNRGARRQPIFLLEEHCGLFLNVLGEASRRHGLRVHAYALMGNHYHLLVESLSSSLSKAMQYLGGSYTSELNHLCGWDGAVFRGRFRNELVLDDDYFLTLVAYIHLNPVRAGFARTPADADWTSYNAFVGTVTKPEWLSCDTVLTRVGGRDAFETLVRDYHSGKKTWPADFDPNFVRRRVTGVPSDDVAPAIDVLKPQEVLERVARVVGSDFGTIRSEVRGRHGNAQRRFALWALDQATSLTQTEIAQQLNMTRAAVTTGLARLRKNPGAAVGGWIAAWEELCDEQSRRD